MKRYVAKGLPYSCSNAFMLLSMFMTCGLIFIAVYSYTNIIKYCFVTIRLYLNLKDSI